MTEPLVRVRGLTVAYPGRGGAPPVHAVRDVSFDIARGETLALVGESGCGKSTTGRALLRLIEPTAGSVSFDGVALGTLRREPMRQLRRRMQIVFQDPGLALDPRMTAGAAIREGIDAHATALAVRDDTDVTRRVARLLEEVGLSPDDAGRYPHEFSGGQRQRIAIARALAVQPDFLVLDEAVSALDVTVQRQILDLLSTLQRERALTYLFVAHNLAVVERSATRVAVMYLGRIVELAPSAQLYAAPRHPYTQALLSAVPVPDPEARRTRITLSGEATTVPQPATGCAFFPRCPRGDKDAACEIAVPTLHQVADSHSAACVKLDRS
jgi:oligopeptide/dipeptide ABC transporter ATP-binding protein